MSKVLCPSWSKSSIHILSETSDSFKILIFVWFFFLDFFALLRLFDQPIGQSVRFSLNGFPSSVKFNFLRKLSSLVPNVAHISRHGMPRNLSLFLTVELKHEWFIRRRHIIWIWVMKPFGTYDVKYNRVATSVTRFGDFLHFGQPFNAFGNN